jgi:hypothetical protein
MGKTFVDVIEPRWHAKVSHPILTNLERSFRIEQLTITVQLRLYKWKQIRCDASMCAASHRRSAAILGILRDI